MMMMMMNFNAALHLTSRIQKLTASFSIGNCLGQHVCQSISTEVATGIETYCIIFEFYVEIHMARSRIPSRKYCEWIHLDYIFNTCIYSHACNHAHTINAARIYL